MVPFELLPFLKTLTVTSNMAGGGSTGSLLGTTTKDRWILEFSCANESIVAKDSIGVRTLAGAVNLVRLVPWIPSVGVEIGILLPKSDSDVEIFDFGPNAVVQRFRCTIVYADAPANVFSPLNLMPTVT